MLLLLVLLTITMLVVEMIIIILIHSSDVFDDRIGFLSIKFDVPMTSLLFVITIINPRLRCVHKK